METKFKNKTLVRQVIEELWYPMEIDYAYDRYENGMSVEDIIATDFIVMKKRYCELLVISIIYV